MSLGWSVEWAVALRRRRLLVMNGAIPVLLVAPLALADPPPTHEAAVLAVLFVLFGVFGSGIPLVRDGASGLLLRLVQAGVPERGLLPGRLAAQSVLDLLQLSPALIVALVGMDGPVAARAMVVAALALTLPVANALGAWAAAAARSLAEAALFSAVLSLLLLHASGVFRTPAPGGPAALVERWAPFRPLHDALLTAAGAATPVEDPLPALLSCASVLVLTWVFAPLNIRLLTGARA